MTQENEARVAFTVLTTFALAASACAPLRLEPTNAGFGNAFQALFEGFKRAARCGAQLLM